jgi:membrane-bound inhibitor of C-type lysozyme
LSLGFPTLAFAVVLSILAALGEAMNWASAIVFEAIVLNAIVLGATIATAEPTAAVPRASAQTTFQSYRCGDGTQFLVAFFPADSRAHMQIDGREVTLAKRLVISGARYSGGGVSLQITGAGAIMIKHVKRPSTACEQI